MVYMVRCEVVDTEGKFLKRTNKDLVEIMATSLLYFMVIFWIATDVNRDVDMEVSLSAEHIAFGKH